MTILGRSISRWIWIPGAVAAGLLALFLLRWPVFGGVIRGKVNKIVSEELLADIDLPSLEGSLVSSIRARNVRLRPRPGSPFRSLTVERVDVEYGLFGLSTPTVTLRGVRAVLSASQAPSTPDPQSIRDALRTLPDFQLPVGVRVRDGRIELASGAVVTMDRADLDSSQWTFSGAAPLFGPVEALVEFHRNKSAADIRLEAGAQGGNRLDISGSLGEHLDLRLALSLGPPEPVTGRLTSELRLTGTPARPDLDGWLRLQDFSYRTASLVLLEITLATEDGVLAIRGAEDTPYGNIRVEGRIPLAEDRADEPVRVVVGLEADELAPLLALVADPDTLDARVGRLSATLEIGGSIGAPTWTAGARIHADTLKLPKPVGLLTDIDVRCDIESGRLRLSALSALLGHGLFSASGHWDWAAPGRPLRIDLKGRNLLIVDDPLVRVRLDPDVIITKSDESPWSLQGNIAVPLAIIHSEFVTGRIEPGKSEGNPTPLAAPGIDLRSARGGGVILPGLEGAENVALDLHVTTPGEIRIENRTLGVLLEGELAVRGTAARPVASGVIRARRGEVKVGPGIFIRIVSGRIRLPAERGKDATVHFVGRVGSGEGAIRIVAEGPLESPDLDLRSDPPRRDDEILAFLAFGRWPGELSGGGALGVLAFEVFEQFADSLPNADRRESVIEQLQPTVVADEEEERRAPWELPAAGTGRGFVLRTEYVLNRNFSVVLESDREGNVRGNLKLRFRFGS